jgi:hypothetical protein
VIRAWASAVAVLAALALVGCDVNPYNLGGGGNRDAGVDAGRDGGGIDGTGGDDGGGIDAPIDGASCVPRAEVCNNADDDCDTVVDNGFNLQADPNNCGMCGRQCTYPHAFGTCAMGTCTPGACQPGWNDTDPATAGCEYFCIPTNGGVEVCDDRDNDCDNAIDEDFNLTTDENNCGRCGNVCNLLHASADCQAGACEVAACDPGFVDVDPAVPGCEYQCSPTGGGVETCDGVDNDCDGAVDDGNPGGGASCGTDAGVCMAGTTQCQNGVLFCVGAVGGGAETCNNLDDDCDGAIDDGYDKQNDPLHCGGCAPCNLPHAVEGCALGACTVASVRLRLRKPERPARRRLRVRLHQHRHRALRPDRQQLQRHRRRGLQHRHRPGQLRHLRPHLRVRQRRRAVRRVDLRDGRLQPQLLRPQQQPHRRLRVRLRPHQRRGRGLRRHRQRLRRVARRRQPRRRRRLRDQHRRVHRRRHHLRVRRDRLRRRRRRRRRDLQQPRRRLQRRRRQRLRQAERSALLRELRRLHPAARGRRLQRRRLHGRRLPGRVRQPRRAARQRLRVQLHVLGPGGVRRRRQRLRRPGRQRRPDADPPGQLLQERGRVRRHHADLHRRHRLGLRQYTDPDVETRRRNGDIRRSRSRAATARTTTATAARDEVYPLKGTACGEDGSVRHHPPARRVPRHRRAGVQRGPDRRCVCNVTTAGATAADETCNKRDDDCDGHTDEPYDFGGLTGVRDVTVGPVTINGQSVVMYRYEASRPDATAAAPGVVGTRACSVANRLPWATGELARPCRQACAAAGMRLCRVTRDGSGVVTSDEWGRFCEGAANRIYPLRQQLRRRDVCNGSDYDPVAGGVNEDQAVGDGQRSPAASRPTSANDHVRQPEGVGRRSARGRRARRSTRCAAARSTTTPPA